MRVYVFVNVLMSLPWVKSFNVSSPHRDLQGPSSSGSCYISSLISHHSPIITLPFALTKVLAVSKT